METTIVYWGYIGFRFSGLGLGFRVSRLGVYVSGPTPKIRV